MYNYNSVIILNGSLPNNIITTKLVKNKTIIAADVPFDVLQKKEIMPDTLIGDLDSSNLSIIPSNIEVIKISDQYTTDFEKAINFVRDKKITPTLVLGINGGQVDHIMANIHIMLKYFKNTEELFFISTDCSDSLQLGVIVNKYWRKKCLPKTKISLFPFPEAIVSTKGLKYQLNKQLIKQTEGLLAIRNQAIERELEIKVHQGTILCTIAKLV